MNKLNLTWDDVAERADEQANWILTTRETSLPILLYGIPRGGIYAAQAISTALSRRALMSRIVSSPEEADYFIDDIVDSGQTRKRIGEKHGNHIPFVSLVNKEKESLEVWVSFPWERILKEDNPTENIRRLIEYIGDDPNREGLKETPKRVIKSYEKLFGGYKQNPAGVIKTFKDDNCSEMVVLKDIEFYSTCEHHMLPFYGKAHIAYIPQGKVIGISKLARLLEIFSRRLQIQERLCQQITKAIEEGLAPFGAACVIEAQHFCMTARGVEKQKSIMITSSLTGVFKEKMETRNEFMSMIGK